MKEMTSMPTWERLCFNPDTEQRMIFSTLPASAQRPIYGSAMPFQLLSCHGFTHAYWSMFWLQNVYRLCFLSFSPGSLLFVSYSIPILLLFISLPLFYLLSFFVDLARFLRSMLDTTTRCLMTRTDKLARL